MQNTAPEIQQSMDKYQELIYRLTQRQQKNTASGCLIIALVSPHSGAGVTHIVNALTTRMNAQKEAGDPAQLALSFELDSVARSRTTFGQILTEKLRNRILAPELENGVTLEDRLLSLSGNWEQNEDYRAKCITLVRSLFKFVFVDCPPLKVSSDIYAIAPLVDEVIIVVEADKTTRRQVAYLSKAIRLAGGNITGYILNKRTYPIPTGLYQALERRGLT